MAKKTIPQIVDNSPAQLTVDSNEAKERIELQITRGEELVNRVINSRADIFIAQQDKSRWHDYCDELLTRIFSNRNFADEFTGRGSSGVWAFGGTPTLGEEIEEFRRNVNRYLNRLRSILERIELIPSIASSSFTQPKTFIAELIDLTKVFLVHGHDDAAKQSTARFLTKLKLKPIILHEEANEGKTVIEKFEKHSEVKFAVVLLTPDDIGGTDVENIKPRARQNVIFELGYFISKLGRNKVAALYKETVELPSDISGVLYIPMDSSDGWHIKLAKELKQGGLDINLNDLT